MVNVPVAPLPAGSVMVVAGENTSFPELAAVASPESAVTVTCDPILQLPFYCHEDGELARERARQYFTDWVESIMWLYEMGTDRFASAKGYEQYRTQGSDMGDGTREGGVQLLTNKFMEVGLVGTRHGGRTAGRCLC